jgi:hypothetical protein
MMGFIWHAAVAMHPKVASFEIPAVLHQAISEAGVVWKKGLHCEEP